MKEFTENMLFNARWYAKEIKRFLIFLTKIKGFWKLYRNYEYDGETVQFIIENYTEVLCMRTRVMSKPTYYAKDVIEEMDKWYEELERLKYDSTHGK